jgi:putative hydrolase of the HAD superfamily
MALRAIFLDAAGTLIKTSRPVGESYGVLARKYGHEVDPAALTERFRLCFSSAPPLAFPGVPAARIGSLERQWWKELVERIFTPFGSFSRFEEYFGELFDYFSTTEAWRLYPEVQETLSALRDRGYILTVVSNFDSRLLRIIDGLGISPWLDSVVISSRVGFAKPAPEIFRAALELHALRPEEAMHVGDSPDKDAAGAAAAGLAAVLVDRGDTERQEEHPRIHTLAEILTLLDEA